MIVYSVKLSSENVLMHIKLLKKILDFYFSNTVMQGKKKWSKRNNILVWQKKGSSS